MSLKKPLMFEEMGSDGNLTASINSQVLRRILIIDDEPYNILAMQMILNQMKIKGLSKVVDRAYNGMEAFTKVKDAYNKGSHIYGLIFTDISMPLMDGFELAEEIRNFYRQHKVPQPMIVACTGHVEEAYIQKAWTHEIDEVIPKPVKPEVLREIL